MPCRVVYIVIAECVLDITMGIAVMVQFSQGKLEGGGVILRDRRVGSRELGHYGGHKGRKSIHLGVLDVGEAVREVIDPKGKCSEFVKKKKRFVRRHVIAEPALHGVIQ